MQCVQQRTTAAQPSALQAPVHTHATLTLVSTNTMHAHGCGCAGCELTASLPLATVLLLQRTRSLSIKRSTDTTLSVSSCGPCHGGSSPDACSGHTCAEKPCCHCVNMQRLELCAKTCTRRTAHLCFQHLERDASKQHLSKALQLRSSVGAVLHYAKLVTCVQTVFECRCFSRNSAQWQ